MNPAITSFVEELAADPTTRGVLLFGSQARGTARPDSDADLVIIVDRPGFVMGVAERDGQEFELVHISEATAIAYFSGNGDNVAEPFVVATCNAHAGPLLRHLQHNSGRSKSDDHSDFCDRRKLRRTWSQDRTPRRCRGTRSNFGRRSFDQWCRDQSLRSSPYRSRIASVWRADINGGGTQRSISNR
jgi:hypothetical protein